MEKTLLLLRESRVKTMLAVDTLGSDLREQEEATERIKKEEKPVQRCNMAGGLL